MRSILLLLLLAGPAMAEAPASAWRVVNRTGQEAVGLLAAEAGAGGARARNRLREPVADGAEKGFRRRRDAPCRLDLRLRLADGREAALRDRDVCAEPVVVFEAGMVAAAPEGRRGRGARRPEGPRSGAVAPGTAPRMATGTGFVVAPGRVMTNRHVVEGCGRIVLRAAGGSRYAAVPPLQVSREADLAVVAVPGLPAPALAFREGPARRGDDVIALGYPYSDLLSSDLKLTRGTVSGLAGMRDDRTQIQVSAPLQPGNSGGPLLDLRGRVLGISTAVMRAGAGRPVQNVNFAVRGEVAVAFLRAAGLSPRMAAEAGAEMGAVEVGEAAGRSTVFILCETGGAVQAP